MLIPGRTHRLLGLLFLLTCLVQNVQAQEQRVEVQPNVQRVTIDEAIILSVRAYSIDAELNADALSENFDVTKRSSSRQVTIENGKRTSVVEWVLELVPKRTGVLEIPPVIVGPAQSRPLTILVEAPASGANRDLFIEASVDVSEPYVQAQVMYYLRVYQDVRFLDASLSLPQLEGALMQQLGEERNYQETVDGRNYTVSEIRYTVFPQRSGKLAIPSPVVKAVVPVNRNQVPNTRTRTRSLTRRANNIELNVKARPDGLDGSWWLPAKEVKLQSEWSSSIDNMVVDQPVTRTVHLMAQGVADSQLPEIDVPDVENFSIYADSPTVATNASENGLLAQQTNTWAVIPQVAGELVLPEVRVNWFDTKTGEARVAVLPEETITVRAPDGAGAANTAGNGVAQNNDLSGGVNAVDANNNDGNVAIDTTDTDALADQSDNNVSDSTTASQTGNQPDAMANAIAGSAARVNHRWRNIAIALLAGWVGSLLGVWFWWRSKRGQSFNKSAQEQGSAETEFDRFRRRAGSRAALAPVKTACESGDASITAQKVLAWGVMMWPQNPPTHISEVAHRLQHQPLTQLLNDLDAQQYSADASVNPVAFESIPGALKTAIDQYQDVELTSSNPNALPAL